MQIFINTQNSSTLTLTVHPSDTVQHLKDTIIRRQGTCTNPHFNLQYCSKYLKDDINLGAYNLQEGSTLFLMYPLLGGTDAKGIRYLDKKATIHREETDTRELKMIKEVIKQLKKDISKPLNKMEELDVVSGEDITLLEYSNHNDVIMVVTSSGRILDYNFVYKDIVNVVNEKGTNLSKVTSVKRFAKNGMVAVGSPANKPMVIHTDKHQQIFDEASKNISHAKIT